MSAGNFGSAIGVTAQISLRRDQIAADAQAARSELTAAFQSMEIPLGAKLIESVTAAAPNITTIIAEAIAAGASRGMQLVPGGGLIPGIPGIPGGGGGSGGYDFGSEAWKDDYNQRLVRQQVTAAYRRNQLGNVGGQQPEIAETMEEIGITEMGMTQGEELRQRALWHAKQMARAESDAAVESPSGGPEYGPGNYVQESMAVGDELRTRSMWHADSMADREARLGALNQRMGRSEDLAEAGLRPKFGSSDPYIDEEAAAGGVGAGGALGGFMGIMAARRLIHLGGEYNTENRAIDFTGHGNMSAANEGPSGGVSMRTQEARKALGQFEEQNTGLFGGAASDIRQYIADNPLQANISSLGAPIVAQGVAKMLGHPIDFDDAAKRSALEGALSGSEQTDEAQKKDKETIQSTKDLEIEEKIYRAKVQGNEELAKQLELQKKVADETSRLYGISASLGDRYANGIGGELLGDQANAAAIGKKNSDRLKDFDFKSRMEILGKVASGDVRGAARESFYKEQEVDLQKAIGAYELSTNQEFDEGHDDAVVAAAKKTKNDPKATPEQKDMAQEVINQSQLSAAEDKAYDASHHTMGFTSGLETWKRMQTAGYGSARGSDHGGQRVYASHGAGGSVAGGMIHSNNPLIAHGFGPAFGGSGATHPLGSGLGFAGFHPDTLHQDKSHQLTGGLAGMDSTNRAYSDHIAAIHDAAAKQAQGGLGAAGHAYQQQQQHQAKQQDADLHAVLESLSSAFKSPLKIAVVSMSG